MLKPGQLIDDKYRIVQLIGEGGMGAVYEAEHAFLERHVAIKVLAPGMAESPEAIRRFYQEAKAAAKIGHENICEVTDVGQTAGGMPYIVMQLLHGRSLAAEIAAARPLRIGRAVDVATQALAALSAAHEAEIVHRDMKPDNIFLTRVAGRDDFVKVLDFGISKVRSAAGSGGVGLTKTGTVLGTPAYMSPEQARGESDVDARADVWAMGVVVYEMLVGAPPFEGTNYNQVIYNVLAAPIPPPRSRRDAVSPELDAVVMRALERDPARRFPTADAFAEALEVAWLSVGESGLVLQAGLGDSGLGIGVEATAVAPAGSVGEPSRTGTVQATPAATVAGTPATTTVPASATVWAKVRARPIPVASGAAVILVGAALALVLAGRGGGREAGTADAGGAAGSAGVVAGPGRVTAAPRLPVGEPAAPTVAVPSPPDAGASPSVREAAVAVAMLPSGPDVAGRRDSRSTERIDAGASHSPPARDGGAGPAAPGPDSARRPEPMGTLTVSTVPETQVFLEGASAGQAPFSGREVPVGSHRLRFVNPEWGIDREERIIIEAGRETTLRRTAEQLGGARVVAMAPADAGTAPPPARDAGTSVAIRREAGTAAVSGAPDSGASIGPPPAADGGLIRIRRDTGGRQP